MSRVPIRIPAHSKYRAVRTDGYASKKEAKRAAELKLLEQVGEISQLAEQPSFVLIKADGLGRPVTYRADFSYVDRTGTTVVEDVKGMRTPLYKLKRRLLYAVHGIQVLET